MLTAVVFDFGEVLVETGPAFLYRKIFPTDEDMRFFLEKILTQPLRSSWHAGACVGDEVFVRLDAALGQAPIIRIFLRLDEQDPIPPIRDHGDGNGSILLVHPGFEDRRIGQAAQVGHLLKGTHGASLVGKPSKMIVASPNKIKSAIR